MKEKRKIKIFCHTCDGKGTVAEKAYPTGEAVETLCPECHGQKWVWAEK